MSKEQFPPEMHQELSGTTSSSVAFSSNLDARKKGSSSEDGYPQSGPSVVHSSWPVTISVHGRSRSGQAGQTPVNTPDLHTGRGDTQKFDPSQPVSTEVRFLEQPTDTDVPFFTAERNPTSSSSSLFSSPSSSSLSGLSWALGHPVGTTHKLATHHVITLREVDTVSFPKPTSPQLEDNGTVVLQKPTEFFPTPSTTTPFASPESTSASPSLSNAPAAGMTDSTSKPNHYVTGSLVPQVTMTDSPKSPTDNTTDPKSVHTIGDATNWADWSLRLGTDSWQPTQNHFPQWTGSTSTNAPSAATSRLVPVPTQFPQRPDNHSVPGLDSSHSSGAVCLNKVDIIWIVLTISVLASCCSVLLTMCCLRHKKRATIQETNVSYWNNAITMDYFNRHAVELPREIQSLDMAEDQEAYMPPNGNFSDSGVVLVNPFCQETVFLNTDTVFNM